MRILLMILRQERMQHMKNDFEMENGCRILRGIGGEVIMLKMNLAVCK